MRLAFLALACAVFLAGCFHAPREQEATFKDCGQDVQCFQQAAAQTCGPAKVAFVQESPEAGGIKAEARIKPGEGGYCIASFKVSDVIPPADVDAQTKQAIALIKPSFALASMDCRVTKEEAANPEAINLTETDFLNRCSGLLVDLLKQLIESIPKEAIQAGG